MLPSPPVPPLGGGFTSRAVNNQQMVRRCHRPRRRHGRRHQPRAPNPTCDEALPSHPHPMLGGTSTPTIESHHGSAHDDITVLVVLAVVMAPGLPIYRSISQRAATSAPCSQPIYMSWLGIGGGGDYFASCSFGKHYSGDNFLG